MAEKETIVEKGTEKKIEKKMDNNAEKNAKKPAEKKAESTAGNKHLVVVRVRGLVGVNCQVKDTLNMLHLYRKNYCIVVPDTPVYRGMMQKVKDYVTWGEAGNETLALLDKRKEEGKKFYRLQPPRKGFGRKGIKPPFSSSGALGYRAEKISELVERMV